MIKNEPGITRIIAGKWKHSKIYFTANNELRPTLSRLKEDMFNWLMHDIDAAICLDLFAGSGSLGIEAISRSAKTVYFIDQKSDLINQIHKNLTRLKADQSTYKLINSNYAQALQTLTDQLDIIFIDPPYDKIKIETILKHISNTNLVHKNTKIIYETNQNINLPVEYQIIKSKSTHKISYGMIQLKTS